MATEGGHASEYDPLLTPKLRAEAVRVIRGFSFAGAHVVIVGGLVPSLLVPQPEEGIERHIGTQDLDLCLSVALVDGNVGNYVLVIYNAQNAESTTLAADYHNRPGMANATYVPLTAGTLDDPTSIASIYFAKTGLVLSEIPYNLGR